MKTLAILLPALLAPVEAAAQERPLPIIDVHLHARDARDPAPRLCLPVTVYGIADPKCPEPLLSPSTNEAMVGGTLEILERRNIIGVISGKTLEAVQRFHQKAPDRLIPAYQLNPADDAEMSPEAFRRHVEAGDFKVLGELELQYFGMAPGDERMEPYWNLAEELDIPVALHLGEGYPGAPYLGSPEYRVRLGSPLLLEEVLVRHPKLRSEVQKRDILYYNAARFLRLSQEEIDRHHGK